MNVYRYNNTASDGATNTELLWHGTRPRIIGSILHEGLRIGYGCVLGKAIHFSELVDVPTSMSQVNRSSCENLLFLCEVDVGKEFQVVI